MEHTLVFYGGCTGIGKSDLLKMALNPFKETEYTIINISELFIACHKEDTHQIKIGWHKDYWKKYDNKVLLMLQDMIRKHEGKLIIINNHFATISSSGYLPGIDLDSLDQLLNQHRDILNLGNPISKAHKPNFGVLLIDTDPKVMRDRYEQLFSNQPILGYLSDERILKDLEENRKWANMYSTRAISILGKKNVCSDTIYVRHLKGHQNNINAISAFLKNFGLTRK